MTTGIALGTTGTIQAQLQDDGKTITLPSGSSWAWQSSDPTVTIVPATGDSTGGTVVISVPAGDTGTNCTVSASTTDPAGKTQTGTISIPYLPVPQQYTVTLSQTA